MAVRVFARCPPSLGHEQQRQTRRYRTHLVVVNRLDGGEIDVVFLDDTWVQRIEVHDEDEFVPQTPLWIEDETTLVLVFLALGFLSAAATTTTFGFIVPIILCSCDFRALAPLFVGDDVLEPMELVEKNVLVALCTAPV